MYAETVFSKTENIESYKKNFMMLKFCMEIDISSADENLIKRIKKEWGKKSSCRGSNQDLNETNGYFKFPGHPQKLVQNNNWCSMVIVIYSMFSADKTEILIKFAFCCLFSAVFFCGVSGFVEKYLAKKYVYEIDKEFPFCLFY